jgi:hypothetical protein
MRRILVLLGSAVLFVAAGAGAVEARDATGTISIKSKTKPVVVTVKNAYLVRGIDIVSGKPMRRIVISVADVAGALKACATMSCSDGGIGEGMTIDLDTGARVNYWVVGNDQLVQYSGTADPTSLKLTTDTPQRVAGSWDLDASGSGGPVIKIAFDAALVKEIKAK